MRAKRGGGIWGGVVGRWLKQHYCYHFHNQHWDLCWHGPTTAGMYCAKCKLTHHWNYDKDGVKWHAEED